MTKVKIRRGNSIGLHKDFYVVSGGLDDWENVITMSKETANETANARKRLLRKRLL